MSNSNQSEAARAGEAGAALHCRQLHLQAALMGRPWVPTCDNCRWLLRPFCEMKHQPLPRDHNACTHWKRHSPLATRL